MCDNNYVMNTSPVINITFCAISNEAARALLINYTGYKGITIMSSVNDFKGNDVTFTSTRGVLDVERFEEICNKIIKDADAQAIKEEMTRLQETKDAAYNDLHTYCDTELDMTYDNIKQVIYAVSLAVSRMPYASDFIEAVKQAAEAHTEAIKYEMGEGN